MPSTATNSTATIPAITGNLVVDIGGSTVEFGAGSVSAPSITTTNDTNTGMFFPAADQIAFAEGGVESMRINASGNVGIGTTSPNYPLQINRAGAVDCYAQFTSGGGGSFIYGVQANGDTLIYNAANTAMRFFTNNAERARITAGGQLLVGTTNATTSNGKSPLLYVYQTSSSPPVATYANSTGPANQIVFYNPNGEVGTINTDGFNTAYGTSSDYRFKHDVQPLTDGLSTIAALKPSTYKWIGDDSYGEGFIAHELAEHIPLAVTGEKDAVNEDGSIKPQSVDYSKIVVHLVAAVQELKAENDALKARIAALEVR